MRHHRFFLSLLLIVVLSGSSFADEVPQNPSVEIAYVKPKKSEFLPVYERFKERKVLERLARFLYPVKLPGKFKVSVAECGGIFKPFNRRDGVVLCYEVIASVRSAARSATRQKPELYQQIVVGSVTQVLLYRTALGLIDVLNIPIWGRYTDAADKLAAIVMLKFGPTPVAALTIDGAAVYFHASGKAWAGPDFAEIRSPTIQRYYNYACLAFGSDPQTFAHFKEDIRLLVRARIVDGQGQPNEGITDDFNLCKIEFDKGLDAFRKAMGPHIDAAKQAQLDNFVIFESADFQ